MSHNPHPSEASGDSGEDMLDSQLSANFIRRLFSSLTTSTAEEQEDEVPEKRLPRLSLEGVAEYIKSDRCKNILVMCGAGISTSAGIPDFRSPGTGLYDNLQKYNLPSPQAIFEICFFKKNPKPFYALAKELYPGKFKPTWSHYFVKLLESKGLLSRVYTQNIDTLERVAGISGEKIVEAHGTFHTAHCVECKLEYSQDWMKERIFSDKIPCCTTCNSLVKPDIVFFGESLPEKFFRLRFNDFKSCDLLIIMGTSLQVQPFASLIGGVNDVTPRLLINREKCGASDPLMVLMSGRSTGLDFDSEKAYRDVAWLGDCDAGCKELCDLLEWGEELRSLVRREHDRIDSEKKKNFSETDSGDEVATLSTYSDKRQTTDTDNELSVLTSTAHSDAFSGIDEKTERLIERDIGKRDEGKKAVKAPQIAEKQVRSDISLATEKSKKKDSPAKGVKQSYFPSEKQHRIASDAAAISKEKPATRRLPTDKKPAEAQSEVETSAIFSKTTVGDTDELSSDLFSSDLSKRIDRPATESGSKKRLQPASTSRPVALKSALKQPTKKVIPRTSSLPDKKLIQIESKTKKLIPRTSSDKKLIQTESKATNASLDSPVRSSTSLEVNAVRPSNTSNVASSTSTGLESHDPTLLSVHNLFPQNPDIAKKLGKKPTTLTVKPPEKSDSESGLEYESASSTVDPFDREPRDEDYVLAHTGLSKQKIGSSQYPQKKEPGTSR